MILKAECSQAIAIAIASDAESNGAITGTSCRDSQKMFCVHSLSLERETSTSVLANFSRELANLSRELTNFMRELANFKPITPGFDQLCPGNRRN